MKDGAMNYVRFPLLLHNTYLVPRSSHGARSHGRGIHICLYTRRSQTTTKCFIGVLGGWGMECRLVWTILRENKGKLERDPTDGLYVPVCCHNKKRTKTFCGMTKRQKGNAARFDVNDQPPPLSQISWNITQKLAEMLKTITKAVKR